MRQFVRSHPGAFFFSFLLAFVFLASIFPITDNDVWWHLETGEYIASRHEIPRADIFSYTIAGKAWTTYEWLSQLALFSIYHLSSLAGLTVFKALIVALIFLLLIKSAGDSDDLILWLLCGVCFLAARDGLRERPQLFTYVFAAAYLYILRGKRPLAALPFLQVLWANMHGAAALIGLGLVAIYLPWYDVSLRKKLFMGAAVLAASFVNPHTYRIFTYLLTLFQQGFNTLILEYQTPRLTLWFAPYFLLLLASAAALFVRKRENLPDTLVLVISMLASLSAIRNIPLFAFLALPIVAQRLSVLRGGSRFKFSSPKRAVLYGILLFCVFWSSGRALDSAQRYAFGTGDKHRARYAAEFLREHRPQGNIFNDYDLGGYLIGKLYPETKVFVDGRLLEYGAGFVEDSFYYWKPEVWQRLDKTYNFAAAVIPQESFYAAHYLDSLKEWALVYWDEGALVYLKDMPENRPLIKAYGYRILKPNSPTQDYLAAYPRLQVEEELQRARAQRAYYESR